MRKISVAVMLFPRFQLLDLSGPADAFGEVKVLSQGECEYEMLTIGTTRGPIKSSSGITINPDRTIFDPCPQFDTVLVPGGLGVFDVLEDSTVLDWLAQQSRSCRRLGAVCNGGFALGAAGLLKDKTVSTHWMDVARMASMFPSARIEPDRIYIKDGGLYTTAGVTAGIDLSLLLIEEDFGKKMALDVAKYLIVYLRRAGGQSQFSPLLEMQADVDTEVAAIQAFILGKLHLGHTVESLAQHFHMSARNLSRVFSKGSGATLISFLNDARIDAARRYLETTDLPIKDIASRCGFDNSESLRRLFSRRLDIGPLDYRQRFRSADPGKQAVAKGA
ncbi:GlxA family transcriptional regulator [Rhodoferax sp.]|uniref:GlxA family transcriptional regulator n=1 Tax=Rhodoferax sp. TaxID=50421 RepID=UPI0025DABA31|nr:GlxA family transcriptional regulator [Rhodoferax sp.]